MLWTKIGKSLKILKFKKKNKLRFISYKIMLIGRFKI